MRSLFHCLISLLLYTELHLYLHERLQPEHSEVEITRAMDCTLMWNDMRMRHLKSVGAGMELIAPMRHDF